MVADGEEIPEKRYYFEAEMPERLHSSVNYCDHLKIIGLVTGNHQNEWPPLSSPPPSGVASVITRELYDKMLPNRGNRLCEGSFDTNDAFITAANSFPEFGTVGDEETRKRGLAAFLARVLGKPQAVGRIPGTGIPGVIAGSDKGNLPLITVVPEEGGPMYLEKLATAEDPSN